MIATVSHHTPEYRRYLRSPEWELRRRQYFNRFPRRCAACGTYKRIHLHHSSYERLTREHDSDLWPLCWRCHRNVHQAAAMGGFENLEAATLFIVKRGPCEATTAYGSGPGLGPAHAPGDSSY
jgi:hypothetical protein